MKKIRTIATDPVILVCLAILTPAGILAYYNVPYDLRAFRALVVVFVAYGVLMGLSELWEVQLRRQTSAYLDANAARVDAEQRKTEAALRGERRETAPDYGRTEDVHGLIEVRPESEDAEFEFWHKKEIEKVQGKRR